MALEACMMVVEGTIVVVVAVFVIGEVFALRVMSATARLTSAFVVSVVSMSGTATSNCCCLHCQCCCHRSCLWS